MSNEPATPEQIHELPRRYAIGKRPLSRLLGWGELTYTRLLDGGVPNAEHSDEIRRLLDDPAAYARLLEIGRERKVITGVAYDRSRRAVDALLAEAGHEETDDALKIFAVADRICALTEGDVTPRTLQMLMHVAQERAAKSGERPLFEQEAVAVEWGFEYPQITAGYSFDAIQGVAARLADSIALAETDDAVCSVVEAEGDASDAAPDAEDDSSKKKGKKGKKGKKAKDKKKDKKKGKAKDGEEAAAAAEPEPESADGMEPAQTDDARGPLSPAECRIIDDVVARYQQNLAAAFE